MKTTSILLLVAISYCNTFAQSIRKNYNEMTPLEKVNLVNAFYALRLGPDLINNLAVFHGINFDYDNSPTPNALDIHFNLPDEPEKDIFLAWHRRQLFEVEQAMQNINPSISIPYWNASTDQSVNSPLWDQSFMGQFDDDWNLNRVLGTNPGDMPTPSDVTAVQAITNFLTYSNSLERGPVHHGPHYWVSGEMSGVASPHDPVFYFHHAYIDKLWQEWQDVNNSSAFIRTNMIRYDGTYVFNGQTIPSVNPNNIVDARVYGVFYANNQLALLNNYNVSNTYHSQEFFFYQYNIRLGNNFNVPANRDARVESYNTIRLQPGFHAFNGSHFVATISPEGTRDALPPIVRNQKPFDTRFLFSHNAYRTSDSRGISDINIYPNPFNNKLTLESPTVNDLWLVQLFDMQGNKIIERTFTCTTTVSLDDLGMIRKGTYVLKTKLEGEEPTSSVVIKF